MIKSPAAILYDAAKNAIKSVTDSADYLLATASRIHDGTNFLRLKKEEDTWTTEYGLPIVGRDKANVVRRLLSEADGALMVAAKPPSAPPGTTPYTLAVNEAQLEVGAGGDVSSPHTTNGAFLTNGTKLYLQTIEVGTEGDSSENGSVIEVHWQTSGPTNHLIGRYYMMGETIQVILPDVHYARDGEEMTGNGTDKRLIVIRRRLSLAALEIDFVIRGYTE
jgi:hypothetical protein